MEHFGALRKTREEVLVSVSSEAVVHDTIRHFKQMHQEGAAANDSEWFLRPIACKDGPAGSLFSRFFAGLVEKGLLEAARSDQAPHFSWSRRRDARLAYVCSQRDALTAPGVRTRLPLHALRRRLPLHAQGDLHRQGRSLCARCCRKQPWKSLVSPLMWL